eukprot:s3267_g4.t1
MEVWLPACHAADFGSSCSLFNKMTMLFPNNETKHRNTAKSALKLGQPAGGSVQDDQTEAAEIRDRAVHAAYATGVWQPAANRYTSVEASVDFFVIQCRPSEESAKAARQIGSLRGRQSTMPTVDLYNWNSVSAPVARRCGNVCSNAPRKNSDQRGGLQKSDPVDHFVRSAHCLRGVQILHAWWALTRTLMARKRCTGRCDIPFISDLATPCTVSIVKRRVSAKTARSRHQLSE